jgi:hypothetical protein
MSCREGLSGYQAEFPDWPTSSMKNIRLAFFCDPFCLFCLVVQGDVRLISPVVEAKR